MKTIKLYLTFNGNCEEAFNFYQSVLGGEIEHLSRFGEMPENPEFPIAEENKNKVMHVSYRINEQTTLLGSDTGGDWANSFVQGNNFSLSVNADNPEEADKIFEALSENGKVTMPMNKTFWDSYFGMLTDQFGVQWMVSCALEGHKNYDK
jgi:PhnB protein